MLANARDTNIVAVDRAVYIAMGVIAIHSIITFVVILVQVLRIVKVLRACILIQIAKLLAQCLSGELLNVTNFKSGTDVHEAYV